MTPTDSDTLLRPDLPPTVFATPPQAPAPPAPDPLPFTFTGKGGEYFRIWIVNLFLSVLTLGIYSAWATVRKKRYFYGHAWIAGSNFEYHGDPKAILRGRVIAFALFAGYTVLGQFSPRAAAAAAIVVLPLVPWLLLRSWRFNAVNSSFRNVRFGYAARYRDVFAGILPVVVFPLATVTFGQFDPSQNKPTALDFAGIFLPLIVFAVLYPWMSGKLHLLRVNGSRFGAAPFHCTTPVGRFYAIYLMAAILGLALGAAIFAPVAAAGVAGGGKAIIVLIPVAYIVFFSIMFAFTQSRVANTMFNATSLGGTARLQSALKARRLAWTYATNIVAILATLGLAIPWAAVRIARVRVEALKVDAPEGLDAFVAGAGDAVGAAGEEIGAFFDFDVAL